MKITIIMPTYNDAETITETLNSVISQSYQNWELIISDDGSTDNTKETIDKFIKKHKEKRIKYYYQENQDQLNAIKNVSDKIEKDSLILILHSDDILENNNVLNDINDYFKQNNVDAIIADLPTMNEEGKITATQKTKKYKNRKYIPALQLLWLGRNLYADTFVAKEKIFKDSIMEYYIDWNTPFWLSYESKVKMLKVNKVSFPIIRYRIFEGNYINNEIGKLNVINGELRTATNLMKYYNIPLYKEQYIIFRIFNKLKLNYIPLYQNKETKNKAEIIEFIIKKRFTDVNNKFLCNLIKFYQKSRNRSITINKIDNNDFIYYGRDMRKFNNDLLNNRLSKVYDTIINEMKDGFYKIVVNSEEDKEKVIIASKFLCIYPFIIIEIA